MQSITRRHFGAASAGVATALAIGPADTCPATVGERIEHARKWRELSIDECARRAGVSADDWRRYEATAGSSLGNVAHAENAAMALNVQMLWILTGREDAGEIPPAA
jgi:transcriptional regulator with XRE-family HTH domain